MSRLDDELKALVRLVFRWAYLVLAVFVFLTVFGALLSIPKSDSRLLLPGEHSFGQWIVIGLLSLSASGLFILGLLYLLFMRPKGFRHLVSLVLLALSLSVPFWAGGGRGHQEQAKVQLLAINEAAYLRYAQAMRTEMENRKENFITYDPEYSGHSGLPVRPAYERILAESPLTIWPRRFLGVRSENDSVILSRGTGMLGEMGVIIFDKGPLRQPKGPDHPRASPYSPVEYKLFPAVFFFTSN